VDRRVFITEDGSQRLYELRSGVGAYGIEANESEYAVLDLVSDNDGISMSAVLKVFLKSNRPNVDHWKSTFEAASRSGYIIFQSDE